MGVITNDPRAVVDNTGDDPTRRAPLVLGDRGFADVTELVSEVAERPKPTTAWYIAFAVSCALTGVLMGMIAYLIGTGISVWGVNAPVGWGFAIINFVFWVGIGHAGTLISAILFLFR